MEANPPAEEKQQNQEMENQEEGKNEDQELNKLSEDVAKKLQEQEDNETAQLESQQQVEEDDAKKVQHEGKPISGFVNQEMVTTLTEMGFGKDASEKALFMTQSKGQSVESALEWINQHSEDADFNEPLLIVGQDGEGDIKKEYQGNLSKEERIKIAEEKIKAARERRAQEEEVNKREAEINQRKMNKEILAAQRIDKEREEAIAIELRKKEKQDFLRAKHKMLLQLEMDRCERKGILYNEEEALARIMKKEEKPPIEDIKQGIKTVKTLYTEERAPGVAKTCFKTINVYTGNVVKDPNDPKFQSVNLANEAFQKRVGKINGGRIILKGFGFVEDAEQNKLVLSKYDQKLFEQGLELLKYELM